MENSDFNTFDLILAAILLVSGIFAFRRGLTRELMALGTWVASSLFAFSTYPAARPFLHQHIQNQMLADACTALGLFCIAIVVLVPLGDYLSGLNKNPTLGSIDRSLGFVFGIVRGFIMMCLLYLGMSYIWQEGQEQPKWLAEAKTKPALAYGVKALKSFVPEDADEKAASALKEGQKATSEAIENARRLEQISTPVPAAENTTSYEDKSKPAPSYGDESRNKMNNIIDWN